MRVSAVREVCMRVAHNRGHLQHEDDTSRTNRSIQRKALGAVDLVHVLRLLHALNCIVGVPQLFLRRSAELGLAPSLGEKIHRIVEK